MDSYDDLHLNSDDDLHLNSYDDLHLNSYDDLHLNSDDDLHLNSYDDLHLNSDDDLRLNSSSISNAPQNTRGSSGNSILVRSKDMKLDLSNSLLIIIIFDFFFPASSRA